MRRFAKVAGACVLPKVSGPHWWVSVATKGEIAGRWVPDPGVAQAAERGVTRKVGDAPNTSVINATSISGCH